MSRKISNTSCRVLDCDLPTFKGRSLCEMHRSRKRRHGDPEKVLTNTTGVPLKCSAEDCLTPASRQMKTGQPLCPKHHARLDRLGSYEDSALLSRSTPQWKTNKRGYRYKRLNGKNVFEHRHVMELVLGRPLLPNENVHHVNGVRDDNRPENLELWVKSQPSGQRVEDLVEWAYEIIEVYEDEVEKMFGYRLYDDGSVDTILESKTRGVRADGTKPRTQAEEA